MAPTFYRVYCNYINRNTYDCARFQSDRVGSLYELVLSANRYTLCLSFVCRLLLIVIYTYVSTAYN